MDSVSDMPLPETALAFLRKPNPARDRPLVTVHVEIDRWFGWSGGRRLE